MPPSLAETAPRSGWPYGLPSFDDAARHVPFLAALTAAERDRLRAGATVRRVAPGQNVWREDDSPGEFGFVVDGHVKLTRAADSGRQVIVHTCHAGALLCASAVCSGGRYCCSAVALTRTTLIALPRCALLDLVDHNPATARALLAEAARREIALTGRIEELSSGFVERRLAVLLARLLEQSGVVRDDGTLIPLAFSRQDLADLCGTTVETVIRAMSRFRRDGIVQTVREGFLVRDVCRLEELARGR